MATLLMLYFASAMAGLSALLLKDILILQFSHSQPHLNKSTLLICFNLRKPCHKTN